MRLSTCMIVISNSLSVDLREHYSTLHSSSKRRALQDDWFRQVTVENLACPLVRTTVLRLEALELKDTTSIHGPASFLEWYCSLDDNCILSLTSCLRAKLLTGSNSEQEK